VFLRAIAGGKSKFKHDFKSVLADTLLLTSSSGGHVLGLAFRAHHAINARTEEPVVLRGPADVGM
jgi:hypothetical protein